MCEKAQATADQQLLLLAFERGQITVVRHDVSRHAARVGLVGQRLDDFVLAVNEIVTNAVRHAGGHGRLRLWRSGGVLHCEIRDEGPGIAARHLDLRQPPADFELGGRGIWLAQRLCDSLVVETDRHGSVIRLTVSTAPSAQTASGETSLSAQRPG